MPDQNKTKEQLAAENEALRRRVAALEDAGRERSRSEEALRENDRRYRALAESTKDIIYILDREGSLLYANRAASQRIGISASDLVGKRQSDLFPAEVARSHVARVQHVFATGEALEADEAFHFGPEEIWLRAHLTPLRGESGEIIVVMGVSHDITARKRVEAALQKAHGDLERRVEERTAELLAANRQLTREVAVRNRAEGALRNSELRFRNYFEHALIGMAVTSVDQRWLEVNVRLCEMLGYSREELMGTTWAAITHPGDLEQSLRLFHSLLAGEVDHFTLDKRYIKKDRSTVHATIHTRVLRTDDGAIDHIVTLIEDITAQKQAQEALDRERRTLKHMLQASDHERRLIAYDIHDGLAQELTGAIMQFQVYSHARAGFVGVAESGDARLFDAGMEMLKRSQLEARRLISGVRPPILDESGVVAAIAHLAYDSVSADGPKISLRNRVTFKRLEPILENAIYRIVQEGLANARNHSRSKAIRISLTQRGKRLRIAVRDWGVGFHPKAVPGNHFGIEGIRERARLLGGECRIESNPDKGTLVAVELPVVEAEAADRMG
jgi:two-component system sensor histidine kinase UhpB